MVIPSTGTTVSFVAVVAFVVTAWMAAFGRSTTSMQPAARRRALRIAAVGMVAWLAITGFASGSGVLAEPGFPPRPVIFFFGCNVIIVAVALTGVGKRFATHVPLAALVGVQAFRLPLELILHRWYQEGVLPVQMTYSGHNFDIISGILGLVVGIGLHKGWLGRRAAWGFNIIGLGLLVTVASIAVMSTPTPLRRYMNDPPVELPFHFPYGWIVPICVGGALFFHLVTFRALLSTKR